MKTLARGLAPLLGALAIAVFAAGGPPGDGAAEGLFLARLAAGLLAATSFVAVRPLDGALASLLVAAAAWVLPAGPPRSTSVVALLAAALALAAWQRLETDGAALGLRRAAVPCAIGAQLLLRSDLLLGAPSPSSAFTLLVLPLAAGAATAWLAERHGARAGIAAAAVLAVGPGWNLTTTVTLIALAAASALARATSSVAVRALGATAMVTPIAFNWRAGALVLAAALAAFLAQRGGAGESANRRPLAFWGLFPALALLALLFVPQLSAHPPRAALLLLPLLPAALLAALTGSAPALAAAGLGVAGAGLLGGTAALAPAAALAALAVPRIAPPLADRATRAQAVWSAALLGATALAAAYPWLRPEPLRSACAALGLEASAAAWPWLLAPAILLSLGLVLAGLRPRLFAAWGAALVTLSLGALVAHRAARQTPLVTSEIVLGPQAAAQRLAASTTGRGLVVDSALLDGAEIPAGTPVAELAVEHAGGATERFVLRAGEETGEWAARRADLRAAGLAPAPPAWISWVAATTPPLFGQRYRARFALEGTGALAAVTVQRAAALPADTRFVVYRLEILE